MSDLPYGPNDPDICSMCGEEHGDCMCYATETCDHGKPWDVDCADCEVEADAWLDGAYDAIAHEEQRP
jgi:hypothetical protein